MSTESERRDLVLLAEKYPALIAHLNRLAEGFPVVPCDDAAIGRATTALLQDSGLPIYGGYRANMERRMKLAFRAAGETQ